MSRHREILVTATSSAEPDAIYALLADGSTWPAWSSMNSVEIERAGDSPPEGVGTIRINRRGRTTGRDLTEALIPGRRFAYQHLEGLPVRDYHARVDLEPTGTGTVIRWQVSFLPKTPGTGWILERGIRRFLDECANGLARYAATSERSVS